MTLMENYIFNNTLKVHGNGGNYIIPFAKSYKFGNYFKSVIKYRYRFEIAQIVSHLRNVN